MGTAVAFRPDDGPIERVDPKNFYNGSQVEKVWIDEYREIPDNAWKELAECLDYPESDLAEFYGHLAHDKEGGIVDRWNTKSLQLWDDLHERQFYVRQKK